MYEYAWIIEFLLIITPDIINVNPHILTI